MTAKIFIYNAQGTGYHENPAAEKAFTDAITPVGAMLYLRQNLNRFYNFICPMQGRPLASPAYCFFIPTML